VTYRFDAQEQTIEARDRIPRAAWEQLVEREPVEVRYRPARPSSNHLAAHDSSFRLYLLALVGSIFAVLGATTIWSKRAVR
jgi:hypothetical protein